MATLTLPRRHLLGAGLGLALLGPYTRAAGVDYPFSLGVASGDPLPDGFVIWTRLAPRLNLPRAVPVRWEVASDAQMRHLVKAGATHAHPAAGHSVHVEVAGLAPGRPYWYRFTALGEQSAIGRCLTAPPPQALAPLRLGVVSCSHWELGYFSAYRHLAAQQPDLVLFLGDYIYDNSFPDGHPQKIRSHHSANAVTLADYRARYALYRTDPDLQALHACAPSVATWDDHEVQNDYAGRWSQNPEQAVASFMAQRAAAYQAFYENMPLRRAQHPTAQGLRLYRRLRFGALAQLDVLDGRQYRDLQACPQPGASRGGHLAPLSCPDLYAPQRSLLGFEQEHWLYQGLASSQARWNLIAQDQLIAPFWQHNGTDPALSTWTDGWGAYGANRERLMAAMHRAKLRNPVCFGGDIHSYWVTDLHLEDRNPDSAKVATEFVGTSVTSYGPPYEAFMKMMGENPQVKFFDSRRRGFMAVDLNPQRMDVTLHSVSDPRDPQAALGTLARFVVEDGLIGAQRV
ncbi:alkaline phosphatase D family protein [Pseudomonas sp. NPDC007930]|uniref:alkaline phosphatase D family protein n=1 Tax=Pseudomonas sp. NPDC007930 TaxID=3364417 RepID=UPI0036E204D5